VTRDIAVGKLFSESNSEERKRANQENVHGKTKEVPRYWNVSFQENIAV